MILVIVYCAATAAGETNSSFKQNIILRKQTLLIDTCADDYCCCCFCFCITYNSLKYTNLCLSLVAVSCMYDV